MGAYLDLGFACLVYDVEGPVLHVGLHGVFIETASDQTLGIEYCVSGVHCHLETQNTKVNSYSIKIGTNSLPTC